MRSRTRAFFRFTLFFISIWLLVGVLSPAMAQNATEITSARVWPSQDYTRVTFETQAPVKYTMTSVKDPERLVVDLEGVAINASLSGLTEKVGADDPYIKGMRIGRYKPGITRVVFDLKSEIKPQAFTLAPVGEYGHRLVIDLYPLVPIDPLLALLDRLDTPRAAPAPAAPAPNPVALPTVPSEPVAQPTPTPAPPKVVAEAAPKPAPVPAPRRPPAERFIIVAVDAGHGGEDPGARGRSGTREKNVTLAIAQKLKARIDKEPNMRAVLTRDGDYYLPLNHRVEKAQRVRADLFVSIHADAFVKPHARGSSVFALSERGATSAAASALAKRENDADLIGGVNLGGRDHYLKMTLADLSLTAQINDSLKLAKAVLSELGEINTLHKSNVEQAGFAVLKAPDIPSILVETAFISNPDEEKRLRSGAYQAQMAEAVFQGIRSYFSKNPPLARDRFVQNP